MKSIRRLICVKTIIYRNLSRFATFAVLPTLIGIYACTDKAQAEIVYGVTETRLLVSWDSASPGSIVSGVPITGLQTNELIFGIDFRPATGELYGLGSQGHLYTLNKGSGFATQVGSAFTPLNGGAFGFDFDPTTDRIRVVSDANNNYVLNPDDASVTAATSVFYNAGDTNEGIDPNVTHLAYTNSFAGAGSTQLYAIDAGLDLLARQGDSAGDLETMGLLGIDLTVRGGFDISGESGFAYLAALREMISQSEFYQVNLATGAVTLVGQIGGGSVITALAVAPVPEPATGTLALTCGIALASLARRRRLR